MVDPSAVLAYVLVSHIKEACHVIFSTHSFIPIKRNHGEDKIGHDKNFGFFEFFSV